MNGGIHPTLVLSPKSDFKMIVSGLQIDDTPWLIAKPFSKSLPSINNSVTLYAVNRAKATGFATQFALTVQPDDATFQPHSIKRKIIPPPTSASARNRHALVFCPLAL